MDTDNFIDRFTPQATGHLHEAD